MQTVLAYSALTNLPAINNRQIGQILKLHFIDGLSIAEISAQLHVNRRIIFMVLRSLNAKPNTVPLTTLKQTPPSSSDKTRILQLYKSSDKSKYSIRNIANRFGLTTLEVSDIIDKHVPIKKLRFLPSVKG